MDAVLIALTAFVLILPVELPDKTFVATLVLSTRYPPLPVWLGVVAAFGVQCLIAVTAGHWLGKLPQLPVSLAAAALFLVGAVVLARGARSADAEEAEQEAEFSAKVAGGAKGWRAAAASFVVLFTAEWGDLSQFLVAGLVAKGQPAVPVFFGAWAALATISGLAVLFGRVLLARVRLAIVRYVAAGVCATLAVITVVTAFTS
ncbi:TMEM165/GDT1 family protein [Pilimelia columellifera]|uniref:GDT1 family protein n=1 Tax=Pilimelia columellifera subsp. columellifera TaxID=706583 RepID=A0ABP6AC97_9ACTN